jgi:hypothetical protein
MRNLIFKLIVILNLSISSIIALAETGKSAADYRAMNNNQMETELAEQLAHFRGEKDSFPNHEVVNLMIEQLFNDSECNYEYGGQWPLGYAQEGRGKVECKGEDGVMMQICYAPNITCRSATYGSVSIDKAVYMAPKGKCAEITAKGAALNSINGLGTNAFQ